MLQIVFLVLVGRAFYRLAEKYNKTKWAIVIMGIAAYFLGAFLGGFLLAVIFELFSPGLLDSFPEQVIGLMAVPLGFLACWVGYRLLENKWSRKPVTGDSNILDSNLNV